MTVLVRRVVCLQGKGKLDEAESLFRVALEGSRSALGARDTITLISINDLAVLLQHKGKLDEAELLLCEALGARREVLCARHPDTLTVIKNLVWLHF